MTSSMNSSSAKRPDFWGYPLPKQGPAVAYTNEASGNPVLRGFPLAIATTIITSSTFVQNILWKANKLDKLKEIKELADYQPRHDPTVIPLADPEASSSLATSLLDLPSPAPHKAGQSYYTAGDYHALYKAGKLTPSEVVETLLPLVRRDTTPPGDHLIAFLESKVELVRRAAAAATERYKAGKPLSALDGIPVAVKDEVDLTGYRRTLGSQVDFTNPFDETAWCVRKWEQAGAIVLGKTNMHEIGLDTTNNNPNTGTPLNPHNPNYYTGGSSGGSAYAVAAGLCPITLGNDGGGSIRLPSSLCGIYGLKPSHGRVSTHPTKPLGVSVGVCGPLASSIDDLALAYRIMAQPDPQNGSSAMFPSPLLKEPSLNTAKRSGSRKKFLGLCDPWLARSDSPVLSLFNKAVDHFVSQHSYEKVQTSIPFLAEAQKAHALTIVSEIYSCLTSSQISKLTHPNQLSLSVVGSHASAQDFLAAQCLRNLLMQHLAWLWQEYPGMIIMTPTTPCAGLKIGSPADVVQGGRGVSDNDMSLRSMEYVWLANFTGVPAISCPMGFADGGAGRVPVGMMGLGQWGSEEQLLQWGREGEGLLGVEGLLRPTRQGGWVDILQAASQARTQT